MEVKIYDVAPNSKENTSISGSKLTQATTNLSYLTPIKYATFENGGTNFYNQDTKLYETNDYIGYCSNIVSDANKNINLSLTITPKSGYTLQTDSISISFFETYCTALSIYITFTDSTTESQLNLSNDSMIINRYIDNKPISEIVIVFHETQYPNSFVKISSIDMGNTVYIDKFTHFNLLEECNVISSDCSINKFEFSGISDYNVDRNAIVILTHNDKLYGKFYTDEVEQVQKNLYTFTNYDVVKKLDNILFGNKLTPKTPYQTSYERSAKSYIEEIEYLTGINIALDSKFENYNLVGIIPIKSCRYALTQIAWAVGGIIDDSRKDSIAIKSIPTKVSSLIKSSDRRIIGDSILTKSKTITNALLQVKRYNFNEVDGDVKTLFQVTVSKETRIVKIFEVPTTITDVEHEGGYTDIGYIYQNQNIVDVLLQPGSYIFKGFENTYITDEFSIINTLATSNDEYNEVVFDKYNLLGYDTNNSNSYKLSQIQKYIQSKGTIKAKIVVENEKVGDLIQLETAYSGTYTGIITSMNIVSLGYQTIAEIEMIEWSV